MGHYDEDAAEAALAHPDLDVSLIASTRRAAAVRAELLARGLDGRMVERLRTPAGKVRGVTQEQIALLALAEVVSARQKRGPKQPAQEAPQVVFATDPVCGMTVDPLTATHKAEFGWNDVLVLLSRVPGGVRENPGPLPPPYRSVSVCRSALG